MYCNLYFDRVEKGINVPILDPTNKELKKLKSYTRIEE